MDKCQYYNTCLSKFKVAVEVLYGIRNSKVVRTIKIMSVEES